MFKDVEEKEIFERSWNKRKLEMRNEAKERYPWLKTIVWNKSVNFQNENYQKTWKKMLQQVFEEFFSLFFLSTDEEGTKLATTLPPNQTTENT